VDESRHEPQDAARALEFGQRGPVFIQPVEDFGVDGVAGFESVEVSAFAGLGRELVGVVGVEGRKGAAYVAAVVFVRDLLEEAAADDLVGLFAANGFPYGLDAAKEFLEGFEDLLAVVVADFHFALGEGGEEHGGGDAAGSLGEGLKKGEDRVVGAARVALGFLELAQVGDGFVHEDGGGAKAGEELGKYVFTGRGAVAVGGCDELVAFFLAKLPGEFAPEGIDLDLAMDAGL